MKLLLAEDDRDMARGIQILLSRSNYSVDHVGNGTDALDYLLHGDYDAAVLDVMMPGMDGISVVKCVREKGKTIPILLLTAMGETVDKITGLDAGADDYLAKPFDAGELLARVRALLRRIETFSADIIQYSDLSLDRNRFILSCGNEKVSLNNKAFQLMEMFMLSPEQLFSADQIMEHIWGWDSEVEINVVWVNISSLRKTLDKLHSKITIRAVRGAGYKLEEQKV